MLANQNVGATFDAQAFRVPKQIHENENFLTFLFCC